MKVLTGFIVPISFCLNSFVANAVELEPLVLQPIDKVLHERNGRLYEFGAFRSDKKSVNGFVLTWHDDGFLRSIEHIEGIAPKIYYLESNEKKPAVIVRFIQGARERVVRIYVLNEGKMQFVKNGEIRSNAGCILHINNGNEFSSLYEVDGVYHWKVFNLNKELRLLSDKMASGNFLSKIGVMCESNPL